MIQKIKIAGVVGARPNFMKIAPIADAVSARNAESGHPFEMVIIHTGQHYDREMSSLFFDELGIPMPDYDLGVGSSSHARQTAEVMIRIEPVLEKERPDYLLVVGDVNSTIAAALVAKKMGIRIVHVEAGLRSFDETMPEEINRRLTDAISDLLFTTEKDAEVNLLREGVAQDRIFFVGNVMVDTLLKNRMKAEKSDILKRLGLAGGEPYAVLTLHRPSNVDNPLQLEQILQAIAEVSRAMRVVFPVHPRTADRLSKFQSRFGHAIVQTNPLGYLDFLKLMAHASIILTDSGGIQEESTVLGVPCLTLRENTERPVTLTQGTNRLVGLDRDRILDAVQAAFRREKSGHRVPELWDGHAASRIVRIIAADAGRIAVQEPVLKPSDQRAREPRS